MLSCSFQAHQSEAKLLLLSDLTNLTYFYRHALKKYGWLSAISLNVQKFWSSIIQNIIAFITIYENTSVYLTFLGNEF